MFRKIIFYLRSQPLKILLIFLPIAVLSHNLAWGDLFTFIFSALATIPLAGLIGDATDVLTEFTNPRIGGLLNATLGNAAELIITIVAIREGLLELVKASITGSIIGNILMVMGFSFLLGGLRHGTQTFHRGHASRNSILTLLAVFALVIPSLLSNSIGDSGSLRVEALSLGVAATMITLYAAGLIFSFKLENGLFTSVVTSATIKSEEDKTSPLPVNGTWSLKTALIILTLSTAGVAYTSELLIGAVEHVVANLGVSEFFLGVIVIPIIGNIAEHLVAVKAALKNQMDLSVEISIASSLQIALFVAPILVFISLPFGNPLQLIFNAFELLALVIGVLIAVFIAQDGESNWLEGLELLAIYVILALAFFLIPV